MVGNGGGKTAATIEAMTNKLYVGNFPFATTAQDLQDLFAGAGSVTSVEMIFDKFTGRSRGFAFVSMGTAEEAQKVIEQFNDSDFGGRKLAVNEAKPREERPVRAFAGGDEPRNSYRGSPRNERNFRH